MPGRAGTRPASAVTGRARRGLAQMPRWRALGHRAGARALGHLIPLFASLVTAARGEWAGVDPLPRRRVYFANHTSNGDFVLIWAVMPGRMRRMTRPVAAADYWLRGRLRRFVIRHVFDAVLIDRNPETREGDPVDAMAKALDKGRALILFPEGKRNQSEAPLLPFKTGLFHLANARPEVPMVPVWIANLNRAMPKGELFPVPLICTVTFGEPLHLGAEEDKSAFLDRAAAALLATRDRAEADR